MVAPEFFDDREPGLGAAAEPPATPPPRKPGRRRLVAAVTALALAGGAGSGALSASLLQRAPAAASTATASSSTTATTTTSSSTSGASAESIYKAVSPGVVTIAVAVTDRFGGTGTQTGSGIVLDSKGDILTNDHVIAGGSQIQVTFSDGKTATATVVGTNSGYDLAVIRVSGSSPELHPVTLGNSNAVQVGDTVYAIGSPFGLTGSFTGGIVSNLHQRGSSATVSSSTGSRLTDLIQTDTPINPGNSGGPLVNAQGQVIGINQSIESPVDGNVGVGFAIPISTVIQLLPSLEGGSSV
jgi:putative serine protease PepD